MGYEQINEIIIEYKEFIESRRKCLKHICGDISPEQLRVLFYIGEKSFSQKELAAAFRISEATLSVRIKKLMYSGYVDRVADENDKRSYRIVLTDQGKEMIASLNKQFSDYQKRMMEGITEEEIEQLKSILCKFKRNIEGGKTDV